MEPAWPTGSGNDWEREPLGPDDLTIRTPSGTVGEPESWLVLVQETLRKPGGFLTVSSGPPNMYAQAINHEGRFLLEYRDGSPDRHFQVKDVPLASIADALSQWMRGERTFVDDHEWERLSL